MKTYQGVGLYKMLETCKKHGLTRFNSDLYVAKPGDIDSKWYIKTKGEKN